MRFTITILLLFLAVIARVQAPNTIEQDTAQGHQLLKEAYQLSEKGKYDEAIKSLLKSIEILEKVKIPSKIEEVYYALYHAYGYSGDWVNALKYAKVTYQYAKKSTSKTTPKELNDIIYDIGYVFDELGEKDSTYVYYFKSIELYESMDTIPYLDLGLVHHNLSFSYRNYEDYEKALFHAQQSYNYWSENEEKASKYIATCYTNMAQIYSKLNAFDFAKEYAQKSINIRNELNKDAIVTLANTGLIMSDMGDRERAIYYYRKAIDEIEGNASHKESKETVSTIYNNLGLQLKEMESYKASEKTLLKALDINPKNTGAHVNLFSLYIEPPFNKHDEVLERVGEVEQMAIEQNSPFLPILYIVKARGLARQNNFDEAFKNFQYAFNKIQEQEQETPLDRTALIDLDEIENTELNRKVMAGRTALFQSFYEYTNELEDLKMAFKHSLFNVEMYDDSYKKMPYLQRVKNQETKEVYETAIELGFLLYERTQDESILEHTFQLSEKFKGNEILSGLNEVNAKAKVNLPKDLLDKEKDIKLKLNYVQSRYFDAKKAKDTKNINLFEKKLSETQQGYEDLMITFEKKYPKYFALKYQKTSVKLADLRNKIIQPNQALVEYFVGKKAIYTWNIQQDKTEFYKKGNSKELSQKIEKLRTAITDFDFRSKNPDDAFAAYTTNAKQLFDTLLNDVVKGANIERLLIIPDGTLNYLPFETLLTKKADTTKVNYKSLSYLINDYAVSYAYASKLLLQKRKGTPNEYLAGFAPVYESFIKNDTLSSTKLAALVRNGETKLPGALKEVESITTTYDGKSFIGKEADEANFKRNASKYQILHLSMHALIDEEYPMRSHLVFESKPSKQDNMLRLGELYNMNIPADMVVLSTCNSGFGQIRTGDGVQSLATAFSYAGAKSTVMSLWKVPDLSTAPLMIDFYNELHQKQTKDEALRQAKLNYMNKIVADELAHPFYWAGFIASGDMSSVQRKKGNWIWWLVGLGSLAVIGLAYFQMK